MSSYEEIMSKAKEGGGASRPPVSRDGSMINNVLMVKSAMSQIVEFLRNELPKLPLNVQSSDATNVSRDIVALNRNLQSLEQFLESSDSIIGTALPKFGEVIEALKETVDKFSESARCVEECIEDLQSPVVNVENVRVQNLDDAVSVLEKILITLASHKEPESVKISNLKDIKFPEETKLPKSVVESLKKLSLLSDDAENPIAVRLSNGKEFVDSISEGVKEGVKIITHGSSGNAFIDVNGNPVKPQLTAGGALPVSATIDTTGLATSTKQDTQITSLQLLDDAVATTGSAITAKGFTACGTDGTNARALKTDSSGELQVDVLTLPSLPAGTNGIGKLTSNTGVTIGAVEIASAQTLATVTTVGTVTTLTGGGVAHDGADSGNPIKTGGRAVSAEITAVANNDRVDSVHDLTGKQIVLPYANPENFVSGCISSAMTGTTSTSLIAAPAAGLRNYITQITVSNTHATVGTNLEIQDGNGGTTYYIIPAAAVYGGATLTFPTPLRQPTTATAIYVKNTTTGASTFCSASGYKGA